MTEPFRLEEATIERIARGDPRRTDDLRRGRAALYRRAPGPITASPACWSPKTAPPVAPATGTVRAGAPLAFPDRDRRRLDALSRSRQIPGPAARIRPHGGDRLRPRRCSSNTA